MADQIILKAQGFTKDMKDLVYTNYAYVNPATFAKIPGSSDPKICNFNRTLIAISQYASVPADQIFLGGKARINYKVALDQPCKIGFFTEDAKTTIYATNCKFQVSCMSAKDREKKEINAQDLKNIWVKENGKLPLVNNHEYLLKIDNVAYIFKIIDLLGATSSNISSGGEAGPVTSSLLNQAITQFKFVKGPQELFRIVDDEAGGGAALFKPNWDFKDMGIGGLDDQFVTLFRRAFASRIFPPSVVKQLGIQHVKGILLYGPPGTGKTLMARQIGKMLNCSEPKIVNGPELLSKYVGESEKNVRALFEDAIKDQQENGDDAQLHLVIFDEFDSLTKQRGRGSDNTGTEDRIVNQLLSMIDGVDSLNDILIIGMTNRKDLIDNALLRPGRFEVQIEVNLPDEKGRAQIFEIHTSSLKKSNRLADDVNVQELAHETPNYTGAEIAGVVKSAVSFAMNERIKIDNLKEKIDVQNLKVTRQHMFLALEEVKPAFGVEEDILDKLCVRGIVNYSKAFTEQRESLSRYLDQLKNDEHQNLMSFCISGPAHSGLTAFAAQACRDGGFSFVRAITAREFIGVNDDKAAGLILSCFEDAYKSKYSAVIIDDIDMLIEYSPNGPRYSNKMLQALLVLLKTVPPQDRKIAVFVTTSKRQEMKMLGLDSRFFYEEIYLTKLSSYKEYKKLINEIAPNKFNPSESDEKDATEYFGKTLMGVKKAIEAIDLAVYQAKGEPVSWIELKGAFMQHSSTIDDDI